MTLSDAKIIFAKRKKGTSLYGFYYTTKLCNQISDQDFHLTLILLGFMYLKKWQILKHFSISFHQAYTSYL